jgi:small subunit ribosomal protein S21
MAGGCAGPEKRPKGAGCGLKKPLTRATQIGLLTGFSFHHLFVTSVHMSIEIKIRKNEPIDRALRRMKKKLDRENIIKGTRAKRYYEKPCEKRRRKEKVQAFTQMLRRRYAE